MELQIPHEIQHCQSDVLRNNAIAAIHRGTVYEQNKTLLACLQFNQEARAMVMIESRQEKYATWKRWFSSQRS